VAQRNRGDAQVSQQPEEAGYPAKILSIGRSVPADDFPDTARSARWKPSPASTQGWGIARYEGPIHLLMDAHRGVIAGVGRADLWGK
jgi:hypothetical protein